MEPTVEEVLTYEPFRRADARAVAGAAHLARPVRWVHISEMPSPGRLFRGNELLLTQGRGIGDDPQRQREWVRGLAEARVSGVAVELGVVFSQLPAALVEEAEVTGLPLITLRHPAYFMDMTEAVHSAIVNRQYGLLQRAETISREFTRLMTQGAGLGRLVSELAVVVGNPVVLADQAQRVGEYAPDTPEFVDWLSGWRDHCRVGHASPTPEAPSRCTESSPACTWMPLVVRGEPWGSVHVIEADKPCDEVDVLAIERAAAAIGLVLAIGHEPRPLDTDGRSNLVHDLTRGHAVDLAAARRKATAFGADLDGPLRVAVVRPVGARDDRGPRQARTLRVVSASVARHTAGQDVSPLVGYDDDQVVVVTRDGEPDEQCWHRVVDECRERNDPVHIVVAVSEPTQLAGVAGAFLEAADTAGYGERTGRTDVVLHAADLGINRLLLALDGGPVLARHIRRELGALLDHDADATAPLLPTLAAYLDNGGHKTEIAKALNIERRTLYYRLERLSELVHGPLDDPETRASLLLALRGLDYRTPGS